MFYKAATIALFFLLFTGCEQVALMTTPKKKPVPSVSPLSMEAEKTFWETLHNGQYARIPQAQELLQAAYLENPNDPQLAAHLGFLHIWKITERERDKPVKAVIVDEIVLARKYFADAVQLNPQDARTQGFLGDSLLIEGQIFHDKREEVRGYFQLQRAIHMWPEFNYFTAGYPMSTLAPDSKEFQEGLSWQWKTLDLCAGLKVDRNNPDFSPYMSRETRRGRLRACWNSWIAPHNFEGFFLNMGDMLVKQGDWQTAIRIYNNAKLSKNFAAWPYRQMLEKRIAQAKVNVGRFQKTTANSPDTTILFNSGYGCVACHQTK